MAPTRPSQVLYMPAHDLSPCRSLHAYRASYDHGLPAILCCLGRIVCVASDVVMCRPWGTMHVVGHAASTATTPMPFPRVMPSTAAWGNEREAGPAVARDPGDCSHRGPATMPSFARSHPLPPGRSYRFANSAQPYPLAAALLKGARRWVW